MEAANTTATEVRTCKICGRTIQDSNIPICRECYESRFINSHDYKPSPTFFPQTFEYERRAFGIELEVIARRVQEVGDYSLNPERNAHLVRGMVKKAFGDFAYLKWDGSLPNEGFEIVTHPATFRYIRTNRVFDVLEKLPVASYGHRCTGLHIHVSRKGMKELQLCKLVYFFSKPENAKYLQKVAQRPMNDYCKFPKKGEMKKNVTPPLGYPEVSRYQAINLNNRTTVEFRLFKGNCNPDAIYRAIQFVDAMVDFTAKVSATKMDYQNFIEFVSKNERRYNLLNSFNKKWESRKMYTEITRDDRRIGS